MINEVSKFRLAIIFIAGIVLLLAISALVVNEFRELKPTTESGNVTNGTIGGITFTGNGAAISTVIRNRPDFLSMNNATGDIRMINATNFTASNNYDVFTNGSIIMKAGGCIGDGSGSCTGRNYNVTFTYNIVASSGYFNVTTSGLTTYQNITKQMPLLGTIIVLMSIAIIVMAGIGAFYLRKGRRM